MKRLEELIDEISLFENIGRAGHFFAPYRITIAKYGDFPVHNANVVDPDLGVLGASPQFEFKFVPHAGKGFTPMRAVKSALGEALERALPAANPPRPLRLARYSELEEPALGPRDLPLFAPQQRVPFRPFTESSYVGWVRLEGGERPLAPGQIAAFGYRLARGEELIGYSSSGGLALGVGLEALYRGALEFVERDAVNIGWHSDIPPLRVRMSLEEALRLVGARPRPLDYKLHVFLWRTDVEVYVVTAHLIAKRSVYAYMPGGGAGFAFEEALAKALGEVGQAFAFAYTAARIKKELGRDSPLYFVDKNADPVEADNLFRVVWYWGYEENLRRLYEMFFSRAEDVDPPKREGPERLGHRLSLLPPYYWYEYRGVEPLRLVKVIIPSLTQYNAPRWPMFGHPRYYKAKRILGLCDCDMTYEELRKIPAPYP